MNVIRNADGSIDAAAMKPLMERLPELGGASEQELRAFAAHTLGVPETDLTVRNVRSEGGSIQGEKGVSGNAVFLIRDKEGVLRGAVKIYPERLLHEMGGELFTMKTLNDIKSEHFRAIKVLDAAKLPDGSGVLVLSPAKGKPLDDLMLQVAKAELGQSRELPMAELRDAVRLNGRALMELHTKPLGSGENAVSESAMDRYIRASHEITDKIGAKWEEKNLNLENFDLDASILGRRVTDLIDGVRKNPGSASLVHGDFHPGNIFFSKEDGITFIDSSIVHESVDTKGLLNGPPARDFTKFEQKLIMLGTRYGLEKPEIHELVKIFTDAYSENGPVPPPEAIDFFRARNNLGEFLNTLNHLPNEFTDQTRTSLKDELNILKETLQYHQTQALPSGQLYGLTKTPSGAVLTPRSASSGSPNFLTGFHAAVERATAEGGGLALDVAKEQLAVAQEYHAAGKNPRHHVSAILEEGQKRAFADLSRSSHAEPERPAAVRISAQDHKRAEEHARDEVERFKDLATKRQFGYSGYTDGGSKWGGLPTETRERVERFNAMTEAKQTAELDTMQRELADTYARDPQEITRSLQRRQEQERGGEGR